ncbi:MAG: hypothetical protein R3F49_09270 [Planctomycetota bacterium]
MSLQNDPLGPFLALSPAEAHAVIARLIAASIPFEEDDGAGAGCIGPEAVVLRFPQAAGDAELQARVAAALEPRCPRGSD